MGRIDKAVQVAKRAVDDMTKVSKSDNVLVISDAKAMEKSHPEIVEAISGLSKQRGSNVDLIVMRDERVYEDNFLSEIAQEAMKLADVVFGCTMTSVASSYHHEVPRKLEQEGEIRTLGLVQRSWEALTGPHILEADYDENLKRGEKVREVLEEGTKIEITSELGTDLKATIDDSLTRREGYAHEPGDHAIMSGIGEADVGPEVGMTQGTAIIDGAVWLPGSPWPSPPLNLEISNGEVTSVDGDQKIVSQLKEIFDNKHKARNIAEIGFGVNNFANIKDLSVWKKRLGTIHLGVGDGLYYGQSVSSPSHIDFVMNEPTVEVDHTTVINKGEFVL